MQSLIQLRLLYYLVLFKQYLCVTQIMFNNSSGYSSSSNIYSTRCTSIKFAEMSHSVFLISFQINFSLSFTGPVED